MRIKTSKIRARTVPKVIPLFMVFALVLAACGGDGDDDDGAVDETEDASESEDGDEEEDETGGDAAAFYEGETVTLATGSSPGGGYDTYMRTLAPYLEEELGATVVPENQTGGGGLVMVNSLVSGEQDGLTLNLINGIGMAGVALGGGEGVEFDLSELQYLGLVAQGKPILNAAADSQYQSLEDVLQADEELLFGATGVQSGANINAQAFINAFDLDAEVATGFEGSSEMEVALLAGDIDLMFGSLESRAESLMSGETIGLVFLSEETPEEPAEIADLPNAEELRNELEGDGLDILEAHLVLTQFHRPLATGPGVPEDRVDFLREAVANALQNEDYIADAEEQELSPLYVSGEETQELAEGLGGFPEPYLEILRNSYANQ